MKLFLVLLALATPAHPKETPVHLEAKMTSLEGKAVDLASYRGKAVLIVNTASECGYTPQYAGLQKLWETYKDRGLVVIGIPSNDFGSQEPGDAKQIREFCQVRYGVTFPLMAKVHARGPDIDPLFKTLTTETGPGLTGDVKWNFTKFLVNAEGVPVARFESKVEPTSKQVIEAVEKVLPKS